MSSKRKRKYVPSILVRDEDDPLIVVDEEGGEHRPHEGEWVRFRKSVPVGVMRSLMSAAELAGMENDITVEQARDANEIIGEFLDTFAHQILDWTWTDEFGEPHPKPGRPGFVRALSMLESYETSWLQRHMSDGAKVPNA